MCGFIVLKGQGDIASALSKVAHRGPDATRIQTFDDLAFGFNRLAIVDKSEAGMQPFVYGNWVGIFIGEIYNHEFLREKYSLSIPSKADTAVILPLFERFGAKIIDVLDGFYSGIIYNRSAKKLYSLRDHIGKKPLLFGKTGDFQFISNELKPFQNILNFQVIPLGVCRLENKPIVIKKHQLIIKTGVLYSILQNAVEKRIPQEDFGVFLSGGLDSSIISLLVCQAQKNRRQKVYFYALANKNSIDFQSIISVKKHLGIKNLKILPLPEKEDILPLIEKIVYHTESYNPSIISNGIATYLLSEQAHKDGLKVVLTGEGADEVFCGYKNCLSALKKDQDWRKEREKLLKYLHQTELRRVDNSTMANSIEVRCPFLDKAIVSFANSLTAKDFFFLDGEVFSKAILRKTFKNDLPQGIVYREKTSCDVGSGIRQLVVGELTKNGRKERAVLKQIWLNFFDKSLVRHPYFHAYPSFDKAIDQRSISNKTTKNLEELIYEEFEKIPFHNLFLLNKIKGMPLDQGGTCSFKTLHFKTVLDKNRIPSQLHTAWIKGNESHRLLKVNYKGRQFFVDVGDGWPKIKAFPLDEAIEYEAFGMSFKTEIRQDEMIVFHKKRGVFKVNSRIPFKSKSVDEILEDITHCYDDTSGYPFHDELRFSLIKDGVFYFIRKDRLYRYSAEKREEIEELTETATRKLISEDFKFNLPDDWKF